MGDEARAWWRDSYGNVTDGRFYISRDLPLADPTRPWSLWDSYAEHGDGPGGMDLVGLYETVEAAKAAAQ